MSNTNTTAAKPTPRFDAMLTHLKQHASTDDDRELVELFERHKDSVSQHFENCTPEANSYWYEKWDPATCSRAEFHGPGFHKGFRQWDVTGDSEADMRIWKILSSGETCFWDAHAESMKDATA